MTHPPAPSSPPTTGGGAVPDGFDAAQALSIADALPNPLVLLDHEFRYRFCNKAMAELLGRPRREIIGHTVAEMLGPDAFAVREPMLRAALEGERQWFAASFDHPQRGTLTLQTQYLPQVTPDGQVTGIVILLEDVTEQRVAEGAVRESEDRFRRIANSAPVIMWVTRLDRTREFVNDAYLAFIGIGRDAVESHAWRDWIHPDDFDRIVVESMAGEESRKPFALEARYRRHDGAWRWLRSVSTPRFGGDGALIGFIGAAFDITLAKEAELALKSEVAARTAELSDREERLRAIFDSVREVVVLLDSTGTVLQLNRTEAAWRNPDFEGAIGSKLWETPTLRDYPEHRDLVADAVAAAAAGRETQREVLMNRPGAPPAVLDVSFRPVTGRDGEVVYILFEARDISDLKGAQEQLRQSQKMEALGQLTGGIAHDFNNLLTVVMGGLDMIVRRASDPKLERYARNALEAAERGARLTAQLLAFSRVQRLEVKPTFVAPLIANMRPLLRNVLGPGIEKSFDLDTDLVPVLADPTQLELAVLNLAINARDAMPEGGKLTFRTRKVTRERDGELEAGEYLQLSISDTGTGMSPEVISRAFDPFFTTKEVGHGTGLGLSMVYGVARQSGGTARIESVPGEGTTVHLFFRRADPDAGSEAAGNAQAEAEAPAARLADILVVDDDADVREFIVSGLEDLGHRVREASGGAEGLARFREAAPDLVVLDYLMPGMSGAEVAKVIRAERPDQPILFVSGYSETDAIRAAAPDALLLPKPFRADALDAAVRRLLG